MLAALTLWRFVPARDGSPSGYSADLSGIGLGAPCWRSDWGTGLSRALLEVPQGNPRWIAKTRGFVTICQHNDCPSFELKSSETIGANGWITSWSTDMTSNPAWIIDLDKDPRPAKSSMKIGIPEFGKGATTAKGDTGSSASQSLWLHWWNGLFL